MKYIKNIKRYNKKENILIKPSASPSLLPTTKSSSCLEHFPFCQSHQQPNSFVALIALNHRDCKQSLKKKKRRKQTDQANQPNKSINFHGIK